MLPTLATPMPTPFHNALSKHKAELIDSQLYIGGSLAKSAMMLEVNNTYFEKKLSELEQVWKEKGE
jgi:hypothetical protein